MPDTLVVHATIVDLFPLLSNDDFDKLKGTRQGRESKAFQPLCLHDIYHLRFVEVAKIDQDDIDMELDHTLTIQLAVFI